MNDFSEEVSKIEETFDNGALKFVHFQSVKNFIFYLDDIKSESDKHRIKLLLEKYFTELKNQNGLITDSYSQDLYINFISQIGDYYRKNLGFKLKNRRSTVFLAMFIDCILLATGILRLIYYIPFITLFTLFSYFDDIFRLKKKRLLYGYRY